MHPTETFQLSIEFSHKDPIRNEGLKDDLKNWLLGIGEESFVEGVLDELYLDLDYNSSAETQYQALGGDSVPLSIYKYDRPHLIELKEELEKVFADKIICSVTSMQTETWMEGWKESFKPLEAGNFYVYPPWLTNEARPELIPIVIEPGMAFGTGQHATTLLCLDALQFLNQRLVSKGSLLDMGTGTGILAIAAAKLGFSSVQAIDIDPDSIQATRLNASENHVTLSVQQGSTPVEGSTYEVVLANIIFYVLRQIIGALCGAVAPGGYLVLSGLLVEESEEMQGLTEQHGVRLLRVVDKDGWICQVYVRD